MTIKKILKYGKTSLQNNKNACLDAEILLEFVLGRSKEFLLSNNEQEIGEKLGDKYLELLKLSKTGKPLAYLTKKKEFYGVEFHVDERVLIPRPETELLVEEVITLSRDIKSPKILDMGTGSGCIAIALGVNINNAKILACDISNDALEVARLNLKESNLKNVKLIRSDLLSNINKNRYFDIIVCNLPYIGQKSDHYIEKQVRDHEPHIALFAGDDGLKFYKELFLQIKDLERKPKFIVLEYGFLDQEKVLENLAKDIFGDKVKIDFKRDLAGLPRMCTITLIL